MGEPIPTGPIVPEAEPTIEPELLAPPTSPEQPAIDPLQLTGRLNSQTRPTASSVSALLPRATKAGSKMAGSQIRQTSGASDKLSEKISFALSQQRGNDASSQANTGRRTTMSDMTSPAPLQAVGSRKPAVAANSPQSTSVSAGGSQLNLRGRQFRGPEQIPGNHSTTPPSSWEVRQTAPAAKQATGPAGRPSPAFRR